MRILHVIPGIDPGFGGPAKACRELCRALAGRGHSVEIVTTDASSNRGRLVVPRSRPVLEHGFRIWHYPLLFWRYGPSLPLFRGLKQAIRRADIIHIHSLYVFSTAAAAFWCRQLGKPYLMRPHGSLDPYLRRRNAVMKNLYMNLIERSNLDGAAAIHFTTEEERDLVADLGLRSPPLVVPNGLNTEEYRFLPSRELFLERYPHLRGKRLLLYLGRINFKKGFEVLIPSVQHLLKERPNLHLIIVGPDDGFGEVVRRLITQSGIVPHVTFTGMLSGSDKLAAFAAAELFVLPSYSENFGIAVIEALACGLPVCISDRVNIWREVVQAGAGLASPPEIAPFSNALGDLLATSSRNDERGIAGKRLVQERYTWTAVAAQLEHAYQSILQGITR